MPQRGTQKSKEGLIRSDDRAADDPIQRKKQKITHENNLFGKDLDDDIHKAFNIGAQSALPAAISHHDSPTKETFRLKKEMEGRGKEADETCTGSIEVDPHTPPNHNQPRNDTLLQTPPSNLTNATISHFDSPGGSVQMLEPGSGVSVNLKVDDREYVLKIKRRSVPCSSHKCNVEEETNELAQSAGLLFVQADVLRVMGEQLLAQYRASLQRTFGNLVPATGTPLTHH